MKQFILAVLVLITLPVIAQKPLHRGWYTHAQLEKRGYHVNPFKGTIYITPEKYKHLVHQDSLYNEFSNYVIRQMDSVFNSKMDSTMYLQRLSVIAKEMADSKDTAYQAMAASIDLIISSYYVGSAKLTAQLLLTFMKQYFTRPGTNL